VDLEHRAAEELAEMVAWSEDSLHYARERCRRKVVRLLEAVGAEIELEGALLALPSGEHLGLARGKVPAKDKGLRKNQWVADMADEVLARQARHRAQRTGEPFERALEAVLGTEAGRQLRELRDGPHRDQRAQRWQEDMARERARQRARERSEKEKRARRAAAWERFMRTERRELELREEGQLAGLLGEPLPGEPPTALERLASDDRRQAQEGLVALMSGGKTSYKRLDELCPDDMPARIAANRARTGWLKDRRDAWSGGGEERGTS
jgi:hypothetical protein